MMLGAVRKNGFTFFMQHWALQHSGYAAGCCRSGGVFGLSSQRHLTVSIRHLSQTLPSHLVT